MTEKIIVSVFHKDQPGYCFSKTFDAPAVVYTPIR